MSNDKKQSLGGTLLKMANVSAPATNARGLLAQVGVQAAPDEVGEANDETEAGTSMQPQRRHGYREELAAKLRAAEKSIADAPDDEAELRLRRAADSVKREIDIYDRGF